MMVIMLFQLSLARHDSDDTLVAAGGFVEGTTEGLEHGLDDMMQVIAVSQVDMQIGPSVSAEGEENLLGQLEG